MKRSMGLLCVLALPLCICANARGTLKQKRNKQILEFSAKLEQGLFGEREFKKATRLLTKASDHDRPWLTMTLAQYQRSMEKNPTEGLRTLAPELLGASQAKMWLTQLKSAEKARKKQWLKEKSEAVHEKRATPEKPTGLAHPFPAVSTFKAGETRAQCALEAARCLADLGKTQEALKIIDHFGKSFESDGRVLAYECLGDLHVKVRMFEKSIGAYGTGLKLLKSLKATEGFSKWQKVIKRRLEVKLANAKRLWDIDRYGAGYVLYRKAEQKRRKDQNLLEAIWLYDELIRSHPETVYSEAAHCYKIQCLLQLAKLRYPGKRERDTIREAEKAVEKERSFVAVARRCKIPEAALEELKSGLEALETKLAHLRKIPIGKRGLVKAKDLASSFVNGSLYGLYRGEVLSLIASYAFTQELDPVRAQKFYQRTWSWLSKVEKMDAAVEAYQVPSKAAKVSSPRSSSVKKDFFGNITREPVEIGSVFNRKTSAWYLNDIRSKTVMALGFLAFYRGEFKQATKWYSKVLRYDEKTKALAKARQWNDYKRLKWGADNGYLYGYPQELAHFEARRRFAVLMVDFFYVTERFPDGIALCKRLQGGELGKLNRKALDYVHFVRGSCTYWVDGREKAFEHYMKVLEHKDKTFTEDRAAYCAGNVAASSGDKKLRRRGLAMLKGLAMSGGKNEHVYKAMINYGTRMLTKGNAAEGIRVLQMVPESTRYGKLAQHHILRYKKEKSHKQAIRSQEVTK